jgi:MFS family permease
MAKFFTDKRGKALSVSVLGYALGEGLLPVIITGVILLAGWRQSMLICSVFICGSLMPFIWFTLGKKHLQYFPDNADTGPMEAGFDARALLKSRGFLLIAANFSILPCVITGLFVYQQALAAEKMWPMGWLARPVSWVTRDAGPCFA